MSQYTLSGCGIVFHKCDSCGKEKPTDILGGLGWISCPSKKWDGEMGDLCPDCHNDTGKALQSGLEVLNKLRHDLVGCAQNVAMWQRKQDSISNLIFQIEKELDKYADNEN